VNPRRIVPWALWAVGFLLVIGGGIVRAEKTNFPDKARRRFDKGQELQEKGQLKEAIAAYEEAIRLGMKDFPRAHLYRANSNLDLKKYDTAIAQYTDFLKRFNLESSCRY
jgi:tetratricopeptide (TPR) repeat protein